MKILLIEDNAMLTIMEQSIFKSLNHSVEIAKTVARAVEKIKLGKFDIVFVDLNSLNPQEMTAIKEVKLGHRYGKIPMLVAYIDDFAEYEKIHLIGADHYMIRPLTKPNIEEIVKAYKLTAL